MEKNHEQSIMADEEKIEEYAKSYETTPCLSSRLTRQLGTKDLKIEKLQSQLDGARAKFKKERNSLVLKETQTHNENVALKSEIEELQEENKALNKELEYEADTSFADLTEEIEGLREKLDKGTEQHLAEIKKLNEFYEKTKEKLYAKDCEVSQLRVKLEGQTILHNPPKGSYGCDEKTAEAFAKAGQKVGDCLPSTCEFAYDTSVYHNTKIMCIAHEHNGSPNPQSRSGNNTRIHFVAIVGERIYDVSNSGTNGVYEEKEYLDKTEELLGKILETKRIPVSSFKEKLEKGGYEWSAFNLHAYSGIVMNEMYKKHLPDVRCMTKRQITKLLVKKT